MLSPNNVSSDEAKIVKARQDVLSIENTIDLSIYKLDNGFYPETEQRIEALVKKPKTDPVLQDWGIGRY
ncbi:type II secretion system protein GspG [Coxiella-like endosymbiont]|uniref:type II secretion system protein GspG n=1 Tax=Coxiella-like endosymbiont TaxID=1592897 RepID=UPI00272CCB18|nr:type II secretion system protein GspG [Coxiella-like endosymbiont]